MRGKIDLHCQKCGEEQDSLKKLHKVRGIKFCKKCYVENRKNHRKETIENSEDKEEIKLLEKGFRNKKDRREYYRKRYEQKRREEGYEYKQRGTYIPEVKGNKSGKVKREKSYSYMNHGEIRSLYHLLKSKGLSSQEASERIDDLKENLKDTREQMKEQKKSEKDIKKKQMEMIEELWQM